MCPFLPVKHNKNQNIKLKIKGKSTLSICRKSLWCIDGIFAVTNDDLRQPEGVYMSFGLIHTPEINQSHWDESGKCSSPACQYGFQGLSC